jgi:hypothetical protein
MSIRRLTVAFVLAFVVSAIAVGAAQAHNPSKHVIEFGFTNFGFAEDPACPGGLISFDMLSLTGEPLGSGTSCVQSIEGCDPFVIGCKQKLRAILTFMFSEGSVTVDATLRERFISDAALEQRARGKVTSGTGVYADTRGRLRGEGTLDFLAGTSTLVYTLRLKT